MSKIFRIIFICSLIIYSSCDDACAAHKKADCASDTTNNCEWTTTTAAGCASSCVTKTTADTCAAASCTWTAETGTCADKTFTCTGTEKATCEDAASGADKFCELVTEGGTATCTKKALSCSGKNVDDCTTAEATCTWTKTKDGSCGITGDTDTCTAKTTENDCTGSCSWIEEVGTCSTKTTPTNGGDNNDKNSCGFLKMSLSIFVLVLFL